MNDSLPDDLAKLQARFDHWRNTRKTRSPIPDDLLQAARSLLDRYSVSIVCRACRLHPTSLHKRAKLGLTSVKPPAQATNLLALPSRLFCRTGSRTAFIGPVNPDISYARVLFQIFL